MSDASSLLKKVEFWASTQKGKRAFENAISKAAKNGGKLPSGEKIFKPANFENASRVMERLIRKHLPKQIKDTGKGLYHITVGGKEDYTVGSPVAYVVFSEDSVRRESLGTPHTESGRTGEGVDNIVQLFNNGVRASGQVYGWWDSHKPTTSRNARGDSEYAWVTSTKERPALHFMQEAVAEFNATYAEKYGVQAILSEQYKE